MNSQIVTVNLVPGLSAPAVIRVSQYDVGRPLTIRVLDGTGAASFGSSVTATIVGTKPSGLGFTQSGLITGNTVTLNTTLAMTQEAGMIPAEIRFTKTGEDIGTANFILAVEPSPHPEGTTDGTYETMGDLQSQLNALDTRVDALEAGGGSGLTDDIKTALLNCFAHVAWVDADGQDYYDALESALDSGNLSVSLTLSQVSSSNTATTVGYGESYTTTLTASTGYTLNTVSVTMGGVDITSTAYSSGTVSIPSVTGNIVITATAVLAAQSITAVYTQSGTVYDTASLDSLKTDLVVTANYSGGTSETVPASNYTLSGTLTVGTSTVTVNYAGLTTTFNVTVSGNVPSYLYNWDFTSSLTDSVQGQVATLTHTSVGSTDPERTSAGIVFDAENELCYLGDFGSGYFVSKTIEIDVASFSSAIGANSQHLRFVMMPPTSTKGTGPLIYEKSTGWSGYSGSQWSSVYGTAVSGTDSSALNYFNGKTVKLVFDSSGHCSLYVDGTLIGTSTTTYTGTNAEYLYLGGISGAASYCYNMTISGLRIYANA